MCGFAGFTGNDSQTLTNIGKGVYSRAHDVHHTYTSSDFSLYHAHLKISDLDKNTSQPFVYDAYIISFVGEIYNVLELCKIHNIPENSTEGELIAALYKKYGEKCVTYLNGEFALSIYDKKQKKLLLFRDRYGTKPLYYTQTDNTLFFSSELSSLIDSSSKIEKKHIYNHMVFGFGISPYTLVSNIFSLRPGHMLSYHNGECSIIPYKDYLRTEENISSSFIEAFKQAVIRRIPQHQNRIFLGLSGGLDSSLIAYFLSQHYTGEIIAYSFESAHNTADIQAATHNAKKLGITHHIIPESSLIDNPLSHEGLVELADIYGTLKKKFPEYDDIKVEFGGDGKEELFLSNSHFNTKKIHEIYAKLSSNLPEYNIDTEFLNLHMLDNNLQMIDKMSLRNGIERRMPFLDYELFAFRNYMNYKTDISKFLEQVGLTHTKEKFGYSDGIGFKRQNKKEILATAKKLLISLQQ